MAKSQLERAPFLIYPKPTTVLLCALGCLVLGICAIPVVAGILREGTDALTPGRTLFLVCSVVAIPGFFGMAIYYLKALLVPEPSLIVDEQGWKFRVMGREHLIPWRNIQQIESVDMGAGKFIGVVPRNRSMVVDPHDARVQKRMASQLSLMGVAGAISDRVVSIPTDELATILDRYARSFIQAGEESLTGARK